ncbi:MAG: ornithine cyclodeaminase family protein, partial [Actinomycetota bacterium]
MLVIDNKMVTELLDTREAVDVLEQSYLDLAAGEGICRPRIDMRIPAGDGRSVYQWGTMEGGSARSGYFAIRMKSDVLTEVSVDGNRTQEKYCIQPGIFMGLVMLLSVKNGEPLALMNDGVLQHTRVAADSAIGVKYGSNSDAKVLGMIGSGGMARSHLEAVLAVRNLELVQVYSPTKANRERYAVEMTDKHGIEVRAVDTAEAACKGADIVTGCTDAVGPVIAGRHLESGVHVTSIGGRPDQNAKDRFTRWLRLADATVPESNQSWGTRDEFVYYKARPNDPVWEQHRHGAKAWNIYGIETKVVTLAEVLSGKSSAREDHADITFSERGNAQGAQFH